LPFPGFGGKVFKARWGLKTENIGKAGGLRIYYYFYGEALIPFFIFAKRDRRDAPARLIEDLVQEIADP
jgi:hypothetical protein